MGRTNWLITGGCGFIGIRLIQTLSRSPENCIRVLDNLSVGRVETLQRAIPVEVLDWQRLGEWPATGKILQFVQGDILNEQLMIRATKGCDVLVHLAANTGVALSVQDPRRDCETNVFGTVNALEAARHTRTRRFVFASSGAPIGEVNPPIHEELAPHPVSPYGASKLAGEGYCSAYARTFGLETVALRFGNVYGPGSTHKSSVVAKFIRDAMATVPLQIHGDGYQTRDFIYVDDLVGAVLQAATRPGVGGEIFQIATERETSVLDLARLLVEQLPQFGIAPPQIIHDAPRLGDVRRNYSDTSKARDRLGWRSTTRLATGIEDTIRWFVHAREDRYNGDCYVQPSSL